MELGNRGSPRLSVSSLVVAIALLATFWTVAPSSLFAGGHTWTIGEVFSNSDGTVQFVRVFECCGGPNELNVTGKRVTSLATGSEFLFTANVAAPTSNKSILLGTAAFAALPGAPAPDHIIADNFIGLSGDTISLVGTSSSMTWPAGGLPLDGINSLTNPGPTVGVNTPENYAGVSGSVDASGGGPIPTVEFTIGNDAASEGAGTVSVGLVLGATSGPTSAPILVTVEDSLGGTATPGGVDYTFATTTITIPAGSVDGPIAGLSVTIVDDPTDEADESLLLQITAVTGAGATSTQADTFELTILDNDGPPASGEFQRGDINQDGAINIADPVRALDALFGGNPTSCNLAEDNNDDGQVNIADPIFQLASLFSGGPQPAPPFGACGIDPTPDSLTCVSHAQCP